MNARRRGPTLVALGAVAVVGAAVVVAAALVLAPTLLRGRVLTWLDEQLDQQLAADVNFGDVELSMFEAFPRMSVRVHDLDILNRAPFEGVALLDVKEVGLAVDVLSLLSDEVRIRRISLVKPTIHVVVDDQGRTNTDITKASAPAPAPDQAPAEPAAPLSVRLDALDVTDLSLTYEDRKGGTKLAVDDLDVAAKGEVAGDALRTVTTASIAKLGLTSGGVTWLRDAKLAANLALDYDSATGVARFGDNKVSLNDLALAFSGTVAPKDASTELDVAFDAAETSFKSLLSLVPDAYGPSFAGVDAAGTIAVKGKARGSYVDADHLPSLALTVTIDDGRFKYPDLPSVDRVGLDLDLAHPGGALDALVIDVRKLSLQTAGSPFDATFHVEHPITDPDVKAKMVGRLDLAALSAAIPAAADAGAPQSGRLDLDVNVAGRMSDFAASRLDAVQASGTVRGADIAYTSEGLPPVLVRNVDVAVSADTVQVAALDLAWTGSDVAVTGALTGVLPYLSGTGPLGGGVQVRSSTLDLRPFQGDVEGEPVAPGASPAPAPAGGGKAKKGKGKAAPAPAPARAPAPAPAPSGDGGGNVDEALIVPVPTDVAVRADLQIGRLITESFDLTDMTGAIVVRDGAVKLDKIRAGMLGGTVTLDGGYAAPTAERADIDLAVSGIKLDLGATVSTFATVARMLPVLQVATGRYDSGFSLGAALGRDGTPDLSSLSSNGLVIPAGTVLRPAILGAIGGKLGGSASSYDSLSLGQTKIQYAFENGKFTLSPFTAKLGKVPVGVSGTAGVLDRTLDLRLAFKAPTAGLAGSPLLAGLEGKVGSAIDVVVKIGGTWDQPKIGVALDGADLKDAAEEVVREVVGGAVDDLIAAAKKKGDELVALAEKQAATLRANGKSAGAKLRAEAKTQGDKLVKDAGANPLKVAAAKEAAKQLASQADKAALKVEGDADKAATAAVAEANKQRDALIKEAETKAKAVH